MAMKRGMRRSARTQGMTGPLERRPVWKYLELGVPAPSGSYERKARSPEWTYLHVGSATECSTEWTCNIAELRVELDEPTQEPLWLIVESNAADDNKTVFMFTPDAWFESSEPSLYDTVARVSVVLPEADRCVRVALYDADGTSILDEELCEPDLCAIYGIVGVSTCGEPPSSGLDVTRLMNATSCDDPIVVEHGNAGPIYPEPDAGDDAGAGERPMSAPDAALEDAGIEDTSTGSTADAADDIASSGCSAVLHARSTSATCTTWILCTLLAIAFVRRRPPVSRTATRRLVRGTRLG